MDGMETYQLAQAQDGLTGEYQQVLYWRLTGSLSKAILIQLLGLPFMILMIIAFGALAIRIGRPPSAGIGGLPEFALILAGIVATVILHEYAHGLVMKLFGAQPHYGVLWKQLLFYATAPGYGFRRNSYVAVALAPLVLLSALAVLGIWLLQGTIWVGLIALCAGLNGGGAAGDLWMAGLVLRYPPQATIVDERDGLRVLMRTDAQ